MSGKVFEYHSGKHYVKEIMAVLDAESQNGIICICRGQVMKYYHSIKYKWEFNWEELKKKGVEKLTGHIIARRTAMTDAANIRIDVELTEKCSIVEKTIVFVGEYHTISSAFDYYLTPHYTLKIDKVLNEEIFSATAKTDAYDKMFAATAKTDAVLVIEGKKLHVNKSFLSFHSDFFNSLFFSNFKEGQMTEIPIEEVTCDDFGLLMSTVYPNTVFPNDKTSKKLLELADRFLMPSVTAHVEYHLLQNSRISNEKMLWMADKYGLKNLLDKCVRSLDTVEKAKQLEKCQEYGQLSDGAKAKILNKLIKMI